MDVHGQEKIEIAINGSGDRDATAEEIESFFKDAEAFIDNLSADLGLYYAINKRVDRILEEKDK